MIKDLFSHKIHSSGDDWPEKLIELAGIFGEFDGLPYNREDLEDRLCDISPRATYFGASTRTATGRSDPSKFRDEISAYPAYLGLYHYRRSNSGWIISVSETAKRFLLAEEPDVGAFLRLQMPLFQYPNLMGAAYYAGTNNIRLQVNSADRLLDFIRQGVHFSPVRLMAVALLADSELRSVEPCFAKISFEEIFTLANLREINCKALPDLSLVIEKLSHIRHGLITVSTGFEKRFHTLRHTELFEIAGSNVRLRPAVNLHDRELIKKQLLAIASIKNEFTDFDQCTTIEELRDAFLDGTWADYFDGVKTLPATIIDALTIDDALTFSRSASTAIEPRPIIAAPQPNQEDVHIVGTSGNTRTEDAISDTGQAQSDATTDAIQVIQITPTTRGNETYPFRPRTDSPPPANPYSRSRELADPEMTKVKRQKRNLAHKELVAQMDEYLVSNLGATTSENDHIDLLGILPTRKAFLFEMKSGGESLLDQIRKGLSQLYEYRYRYRSLIEADDLELCLVLPENPLDLPWIIDYLCEDRQIAVCWFEDGQLVYPVQCADRLADLTC